MDYSSAYDFSGLKIVVADDNRFMRQLLTAVLTGMRVPHPFKAESGEVALRIIAETQPDLLIADWEMPAMTGIELVRHLRDEETSPSPTLPIIMMASHCALDRVIEARDAGANEFMAKPITVDAVYKRLINLIERPRPFIRLESYFGPDRRRKIEDFAGDNRRQVSPSLIMTAPAA
jgi:CheY-like chemotaxis protein